MRLVVTSDQLNNAHSRYAYGIYPFDPNKFLELTTSDNDVVRELCREALDVSLYNAFGASGETQVMPMLTVKHSTGKILNHEGRHRACALINSGENTMQVAMYYVDDEYNNLVKYDQMTTPPGYIYGEYGRGGLFMPSRKFQVFAYSR